jgi:cyclin H
MAAAEDARYRQSTQYRLWSFSAAQLASTREKTNGLARSSISERLVSNNGSNSNNDTSGANTPDPSSNDNSQHQASSTSNSLPEFLSPADEAQLLTFYTVELLRAGTFCEIPTDMKATAAVFLRRFYVTNSIMTYPPTEMLKTCLFFGCKAEGWYQSATRFADKFPNTTAEEILAGEFLLCQGLRFAFDVKHPFRALEGAIMELRRYGDLEVR